MYSIFKGNMMSRSPFIESIRVVLRTKHYSLKTEKAYLHWIRRFIYFNGKRHPKDMGELEVEQFLAQAIKREIGKNKALLIRALPGSLCHLFFC